ncbi:MAG: hypothetical protein FJ096_12445 [Deltaproteobacteria bacterium]|nr:hypothetical protein [Deltaproteobacteria bacterium]
MKRTTLATVMLVSALVGCSKKEDASKAGDASKATGASTSAATTNATTTPAGGASAPASTGASALAHLPEKCAVAARLDVTAFVAHPAVKSQVTPAAEKLKKGGDASGKGLQAFIAEAGIDPMTDLKEVALCAADLKQGPEGDFTIALGGNLKPGTVVAGIEKHGKAENFNFEELAGTKIIADKGGKMFLGQATDGVVVLASTKAGLEAGLKGSGGGAKLGLPLDATASLLIPGDAMKQALDGPGTPFAAQAKDAGRALLTLDLAKSAAQLRIAMKDEKGATEFAGVLKMLLGQMAQQPAMGGDPMAAMGMAMLKDAKIDAKGADTVVDVAIPAGQIDELAKRLGTAMANGK